MKKFYCLLSCIVATFTWAQQKDSLNLEFNENLETVVITGQINPQSVNKSVFEVDIISREMIDRMAGSTLEDVLTQSLNLNISPNAGEGRSGLQQFGFDSEYIKIMVDGIPVIGDEGFGNAIDISQINLDDIQQIELIEGSMGVQYGPNAVTGVVNIITKKNSKYRWQITPSIQEETIGSEYNWKNQGRHIQSLKLGSKFSKNWYAESSYTRNDFKGYFGHKKGANYANPDNANDGLRGYEWLPKEQNVAKALLNYNSKKFNAFYKFEYFDEQTEKYAQNVLLNPNNSTQTLHPTANDALYRTHRYYHHLNANGKLLNRMNYNLSVSIQNQTRNIENYTYALNTGSHTPINRYDYNTRRGFFSRGSFNPILSSNRFAIEFGYELEHDKGSAGGLSEQNINESTQFHTLNSVSGFVSSEIHLNDQFSLRPGFRYSHSNQFSDLYTFSLSGKYIFSRDYELRLIVGTAPKLPNFEQLFFYLVDSNHDVRGNEALKPEKGKSAFLHLKKTYRFAQGQYQPKLSLWYLDVDDKIDLVITNPSPLSYEFQNIDLYKTWGVAWRNKFQFNQLDFSLGMSLTGEAKQLNSEAVFDERFLYALQFNTDLNYTLPKLKTVFSAQLKYIGPYYQFVSSLNHNNEAIVVKQKQEGYTWLNASVRKQFFNEKVDLTLGARNILNVKEIDSGIENSPLALGYGRSYFFKIQYNLNF